MLILKKSADDNKHVNYLECKEMLIYLQMDASMRTCTAYVGTVKNNITLTITFPTYYPNGEAPSFDLTTTSGFPANVSRKQLLKVQYRFNFLKPSSKMC